MISPPPFLPALKQIAVENGLYKGQRTSALDQNKAYLRPGKSLEGRQLYPSRPIPLIPLAQLGLSVVATGADYTLYIRNYDLFKEVLGQKSFVANYQGQKVFKLGFKGNQYIPAKVIAAQKANFFSNLKTLKLVKSFGSKANIAGLMLSAYNSSNSNTVESWSKFSLDIIMFGIGFIAPFGWVISGAYGLIDGALSVSEIDWWHSFYNSYIINLDNYFEEAWKSFEECDNAHRKVTGEGIFSGPKF